MVFGPRRWQRRRSRRQRRRVIRRILFVILALIFAAVALRYGHPVYHIAHFLWNDRDERQPPPPGSVDDASRLNQTAVQSIIDIPQDPQAAVDQLTALVRRAGQEHLHIAIAGARHSMGGHTIYPSGIALNMLPFHQMSLDEKESTLHVGAGARWAEIIPYLDNHGFSVAVMQSFNDFSIGGTLSVNAHGWTYDAPPIASTVQSLHLITAEGRIMNCSRTENAELFSLVLGGYGLFGVILDADLHVVRNARYTASRTILHTSDLARTLHDLDAGKPPALLFARLSIAPESLLDEAILNVFCNDPGPIPALGSPAMSSTVRAVYRGAAGNDYGKSLRWDIEKWRDEERGETIFSRNQLLNEPFTEFENRTTATTDILQEYFLPAGEFAGFTGDLKKLVREEHADLINATVRDVRRDDTTFLRYADGDMLALVLLFVQPRSPAGEASMERLTRAIIDAAAAHHGRYYLPYRLHALPAQLAAAYPMAGAFFNLKRKYDPQEIFQNEFYVKYGGPNPGAASHP